MSLPRLQHTEAQDPAYFRFRRQMMTFWFIWSLISIVTLMITGLGIIIAPLAMGYVLLITVTRSYHKTQVESFQHYRQIEALMNLHALIDIRYPLPPMRLWAVSPDFVVHLVTLIFDNRPRHILELGSGSSTTVMCYCLEKLGEGHITAVEHQSTFAENTVKTLARHHLSDWGSVLHAPLTEYTHEEQTIYWYDLPEEELPEAVDILIVDGPPNIDKGNNRAPALPALFDRLIEGAIIVVDDYMRQDEHAMVNDWLERYPLDVVETISNEKGTVILRKREATASPPQE